MKRLLITVRDPASTEAMIAVLPALEAEQAVEFKIFAQEPAGSRLLKEAAHPERIKVVSSLSETELFALMREAIADFQPNLLLTGISGPDHGIDEVTLVLAREVGLPTFAIQCYWGDINEALGVFPETVFVVDEFARDITERRTGARTEIVGALKYQKYSSIDTNALRGRFRGLQGLADREVAVSFFGQPLGGVDGYWKTIEDFSQYLGSRVNHSRVFYRPHPKEAEHDIERTKDLFVAQGNVVLVAAEDRIESVLAGTDVSVSAFSTCCIDLQYLIRSSALPIGCPVYLFYHPELVAWYQTYTKIESIPQATDGLAVLVSQQESLGEQLDFALSVCGRQRCFKAVSDQLTLPSDGVAKVVQYLLAA